LAQHTQEKNLAQRDFFDPWGGHFLDVDFCDHPRLLVSVSLASVSLILWLGCREEHSRSCAMLLEDFCDDKERDRGFSSSDSTDLMMDADKKIKKMMVKKVFCINHGTGI
jgi:hypothetical protein